MQRTNQPTPNQDALLMCCNQATAASKYMSGVECGSLQWIYHHVGIASAL
jgi:hypothetical protein